jgi:N-acetylated-alpha-linked acidic dipeptidase
MISFAAVGLLCTSMALGASAPPPSDEAALERNFDTLIQPNDLRDWMKLLAAEPNHVGSPHDKANAERILTWFKDWGWNANIETFWVLYPTPINESLELVRSKPFKATLQEKAQTR